MNSPVFDTAFTATRHEPATPPRLDLYTPIHKAIRHFMTDTLLRVGRMDVNDAEEVEATLGQLDTLMSQCVAHLDHENSFIHAAIEARRPGASHRIAEEHLDHLESIDALRADTAQLRRARADDRAAAALRLYRHLALFVAENLQHMHIEETANNAALWAHYTDEELVAIHDRLLASIAPAEMMLGLRWMVPALTPQQRAGMFGEMKAGAPAEVFNAVVDTVRPHLAARDWSKLASALA